MLIAQISDIHIVEKGELTLGVAPMAENLQRCIEHLNHMQPKPDCVLITGDITDKGSPDSYRHAAEILARLEMPYWLIPGNHDDNQNLWAEFNLNACPTNNDDFINYVVDDFSVRLIGMDSSIDNMPGGEVTPKQLSWLETELQRETKKPTLIFMHHPPVKCGVLESDRDGFVGAGMLGELLAKYDNVERLICGHIHLPTHTLWSGTTVSTSPSIGIELSLDLTLKKPSGFLLVKPAYQLHLWTKHNNLVSHTVQVHEDDAPLHLF